MSKVDRLKILDDMSERLEGKTIFKKTVWLIMDKKRNVIAKGVPRNRYLILVDNLKDKKRVLTYSSKKMAENGFKSSFFYTTGAADKYVKKNYGCEATAFDAIKFLEAVEAILIVKI